MDLKSLVPFPGRSTLAPADLYPFDALRREVNGLFFDFARALAVPSNGATMLAPRIEVTESDKEIEISAELPGLERKDLDISLDRNLLTIRGVFYRMLELPLAVDPSTVQATMSNGVLKIAIPKPERTETKKIEVKEAA
jgi:HSP20 family protein